MEGWISGMGGEKGCAEGQRPKGEFSVGRVISKKNENREKGERPFSRQDEKRR